MRTFISYSQSPSEITLQRWVTDPLLMRSEEELSHEDSSPYAESARLARALYWLQRTQNEQHLRHAQTDLDARLVELFCDLLSSEEAAQLWHQIEQCSVCRSLAEEVGLDLQVLETTLSTRAISFMEAQAIEWQRRETEWKLNAVPEAEVLNELAPLISPEKTAHDAQVSVTMPENEDPSTNRLKARNTFPFGAFERFTGKWFEFGESLRWLINGAAVTCTILLIALILRSIPSVTPEGVAGSKGGYRPLTSPESMASSGPLVHRSDGMLGPRELLYPKGTVSTVGNEFTVSLEGDLLMQDLSSGQWEVVASLSSVSRPEAQARNSAELRLRATLEGTGYLTLWHVSTTETVQLYAWPRDTYNQSNAPLAFQSGERLEVALPGETGQHAFVLTLSAAPVPNQVGRVWLDEVLAGRLKSVGAARVVWQISP